MIAATARALVAGFLIAGCARGASAPRQQSTATADSLIAVGEQVYYRGAFDSARAIWKEALTRAKPGDSLTEPRVLTWLGLAAYRQGDYVTARSTGERALSLKLQRHLRSELPKSYNALGLLAWNEGRLTDADSLFRTALEIARVEGDRELVAKAGNNLGLIQTELGDFDEARANFSAALDAGRATDDARMQGGALTNLGMLDVWLGDPDAAVGKLTEAHRLYRSIGYETGEENVLGQLGTAYAGLGEPQRAFAALDSALAIARKEGMRAQEASDLETLADFYRTFGDDQHALDTYARARAINRELELQVELANNFRNEAAIRADAGLLKAALDDAASALKGHQAAGAQFEELHDLLLLADLEDQAHLTSAAKSRLASAERLAGRLSKPIGQAELALARARITERAHDSATLLRILDASAEDVQTSLSGSVWEVEAMRARAHAALRALDSAAAAGRRAVAAIERVRGNLAAGPLHSSFVSARAAVYGDLVVVLLRQGREDEAFQVADGARTHTLLQHLPVVRDGLRHGPARDLVETEALLRRIDLLLTRLGQAEEREAEERGENGLLASELGRRLQEARSEYEALLVRRAAERGGSLLQGGDVPASAVRGSLAQDEALLEYLITSDRLIIFVLRRDSLRVIKTPVQEADLNDRIRLARDLLAQRGTAPGEGDAVEAALYQVLLQPVIHSGVLTGARRLLLVTPPGLTGLPFAALLNPSTGRRLVEDFALSSVPTGSALTSLRRRATTWPAGTDLPAAVFAPFPERLPATHAEAAGFRRALPRATVRLGQAASEPNLRQSLSRGALVHVASHGMLNPFNPMFSRIELARQGSRPEDDGRLEVHELLDLSIRSPLVFLSGCETGIGRTGSTDFASGGDFGTLAQGFLSSGALNVVATLWRIDDAGAAVFAERFYQHLRHSPPSEALAAAQRELQRSQEYKAPYYWAAYVLSGGGT